MQDGVLLWGWQMEFEEIPFRSYKEEEEPLPFSLSQISSSERCKQKRKQLFLQLSSHSHMPGFNVANMWGERETGDCFPF